MRRGDKLGESLVAAAMEGDVRGVEKALAGGASVGYFDGEGKTALMYASSYGHMPVIEALLAAGAEVDARSATAGETGQTALMQAAGSHLASNRVEVVERLLAAGAGVDLQDDAGWCAIMHATTSDTGYVGPVEALLAAGANPELADPDGNTPLMVAASLGVRSIVKRLAAAGASRAGIPSVRLIDAAEAGRAWKVKRLIAAGADVDHRFGTTPLTAAAGGGHTKVVQALLAAGADVNRGEREPGEPVEPSHHDAMNPLIHAAYGAHVETLEALIAAGADLAVSVDGRTALDCARAGKLEGNFPERRWDEAIECLVKAGAPAEAT